jgi:Dockerin type I domain
MVARLILASLSALALVALPLRTLTPSTALALPGCQWSVSSQDATLILQYHAGLLDSVPDYYDINHNGVINSVDALFVLWVAATGPACVEP